MKKILSAHFCLLFLVIAGCSNAPVDVENGESQHSPVVNKETTEEKEEVAEEEKKSGTTTTSVVMHEVRNQQTGLVSEYIPLPTYWKITPQGWTGPDGARVQVQKGGVFTDAQGYLPSFDQIVQQTLLPYLQQNGYKYVKTVELPEVSRRDQQAYAQYWKAMPSQEFHEARGIEYIDGKGQRGIIIPHYTLSRSQYGSMVHYYSHVLQTSESAYPRALKEVVYALANAKSNPEAVALHNRNEQQKSQASWGAHNSRMQSNQRNFESWQQTQQTLSEANDISYEGWKQRNEINDRMHDKTIDAIRGEETMMDPYTGQHQKVESGYKYYYMNQFGEYIGTNDEFYDPSQDPQLNYQEWQKVEKPKGY